MPKKVLWVSSAITVILWIGVGIYYLKTEAQIKKAQEKTPVALAPPPTITSSVSVQPTKLPVWERYTKVEWTSGPFSSWEKIENSQDRFLIMADGDFASQTNRLVSKIRIVFGEEATALVAEKNGKTEWTSDFSDFTEEEVNNLIIPSEYIKIVFKLTEDKQENIRDEDGNFLVEKIVRRLGE